MTTAVAIDHIQIAIPAGGEADGRQYFSGLLGLTEIPKPSVLAGRGGCWFAVGELQIHLGIDPDFRPAKKAHVAFKIENLADLRLRLEALGFPTMDDPAGMHRFFSEDPFGNRMEFIAI